MSTMLDDPEAGMAQVALFTRRFCSTFHCRMPALSGNTIQSYGAVEWQRKCKSRALCWGPKVTTRSSSKAALVWHIPLAAYAYAVLLEPEASVHPRSMVL